MEIRADEISRIIREQIKDYGKKVDVAETGSVLSQADGVARIHGLSGAAAGELLEFPGGVSGLTQRHWNGRFGKHWTYRYVNDVPLRAEAEPEWDPGQMAALGMVPNYYLQYFYYTDRKIHDQEKWPPSRAEEVMEIEKDLLREYADPALTEPPADLMKRGGAYYSTLATQVIESHHRDLGQVHVVNVPNHGAVPEWPADWVLELPARVDRSGIHPLPAQPLPASCFGLVSAVKMYELLAVEAAVAPLPVTRMDFPYRLAGRKAPDREPVLLDAVREQLYRRLDSQARQLAQLSERVEELASVLARARIRL